MEREELLKSLIGKSENECREICKNNKLSCRIVRKDSENYCVTCDFDMNRVNLQIDNEIVSSCNIG